MGLLSDDVLERKKRFSIRSMKNASFLLIGGLVSAFSYSFYNNYNLKDTLFDDDSPEEVYAPPCNYPLWDLQTFEKSSIVESNAHTYNASFGLFNYTDYSRYPKNNVTLSTGSVLGEELGMAWGVHFDDLNDSSDVYFLLLDMKFFNCKNGFPDYLTIGKIALNSAYTQFDNYSSPTAKIASLQVEIPRMNYDRRFITIVEDRISDKNEDGLLDYVKPLNLKFPFGYKIKFTLSGDYSGGVYSGAKDKHIIADFYVGDWTPESLEDSLSPQSTPFQPLSSTIRKEDLEELLDELHLS